MTYFDTTAQGFINELLKINGHEGDYTLRPANKRLKPFDQNAGKWEREVKNYIRSTQLAHLRCMDGDLLLLDENWRIKGAVSLKTGEREESAGWQIDAMRKAFPPEIVVAEMRRLDCDVPASESRYRIYYHK